MRYMILLSVCVVLLSSSPALAVDNWNVELVAQTLGPASDVFTAGDRAYLCAGSYLVVLDVADPRHPAEMGRIRTPGLASGVHVSGSYAYVADYYEGLRVIDISTPASPEEVGFYNTPGGAYGVYVSGSYAYVADVAGLRVIDISTPSSPREVGFYYTPVLACGVYVSGSCAYVAAGYEGLRVIDISTPSSPKEVGFYDTPGCALGVHVSGSYAYVADGWGGLCILRYLGAQAVEPADKQPTTWGQVKRTELYQNYPNPFNPETWIPYQLAQGSEVIIRIYSAAGQLIRTMEPGYKAAGSYVTKDAAAYWDSKTDAGECVSSGVYFYVIKAGEYTAIRKMAVAQ